MDDGQGGWISTGDEGKISLVFGAGTLSRPGLPQGRSRGRRRLRPPARALSVAEGGRAQPSRADNERPPPVPLRPELRALFQDRSLPQPRRHTQFPYSSLVIPCAF